MASAGNVTGDGTTGGDVGIEFILPPYVCELGTSYWQMKFTPPARVIIYKANATSSGDVVFLNRGHVANDLRFEATASSELVAGDTLWRQVIELNSFVPVRSQPVPVVTGRCDTGLSEIPSSSTSVEQVPVTSEAPTSTAIQTETIESSTWSQSSEPASQASSTTSSQASTTTGSITVSSNASSTASTPYPVDISTQTSSLETSPLLITSSTVELAAEPSSNGTKAVVESASPARTMLSGGAIAGIVIGVVASFAFLLVAFCLVRHRRRGRSTHPPDPHDPFFAPTNFNAVGAFEDKPPLPVGRSPSVDKSTPPHMTDWRPEPLGSDGKSQGSGGPAYHQGRNPFADPARPTAESSTVEDEEADLGPEHDTDAGRLREMRPPAYRMPTTLA